MAPTTSGGSTATDFQPMTRNPQGNVGGGLQPNSATLQPVTSSSGSNSFNQPGVNPQAFPQTGSLRVVSTGTAVQASGADADIASDSQGFNALTLFFLAIAVVIVVIVILIKVAKPAQKAEQEPEKKPTITENPIAKAAKPKKKSKKKKKSTKKKK